MNFDDRLQSFRWAIRPPLGVVAEGQLMWQMSAREGMYRAGDVLREVAASVPYFHAALDGVPEVGIDLKINQLASMASVE